MKQTIMIPYGAQMLAGIRGRYTIITATYYTICNFL
jgi:hypothetical protein